MTESIPAENETRIRHIQFSNGKHKYHIELFRDNEWMELSSHDTFKDAANKVDLHRGNRVTVNEIMEY